MGIAAPGGVLLAALSLYPIYLLTRMSVSEVSSGTLNGDWPFVGVQNFLALLQGSDLGGATLRTGAFVVLVTVVGIVGGLGAAIALRSSRPGSAFLLGMMVFIWAMPPVVNGSIWKFLLADQGLVNTLVRATGLSAEGVPFLYDARFALLSVAIVNAWAVIPFNALVFRSALLGIDPEILEAASVDGASRWQEIRSILIPAARPTAVILAILTVVYAFRSFDFIYVMTAGGPGDATSTLPYLSYSQAFVQHDYGLGSATGIIALVIVAVLAVVYVRSTRSES
ncbi:carbohydrate ABC transporter permease [Clavibacter michiganensis]|uniref:carbohydrate ABC transporter permease n=1 Tax=Clavibacter michiganensis TaxID=28447 RepID=UPI0011B0E6A0|nr:sugar ABC transporter permease [Clavibacter michiganensis]